MDINAILFPILVLGCMGVIFGAILGFASIIFRVEQDPKVPLVRECLPGANCGGCGFAGCDALSEAIAKGEAPVNACPVGGAAVAEKVAAVMGVEAGSSEKMTAFVILRQVFQADTKPVPMAVSVTEAVLMPVLLTLSML